MDKKFVWTVVGDGKEEVVGEYESLETFLDELTETMWEETSCHYVNIVRDVNGNVIGTFFLTREKTIIFAWTNEEGAIFLPDGRIRELVVEAESDGDDSSAWQNWRNN